VDADRLAELAGDEIERRIPIGPDAVHLRKQQPVVEIDRFRQRRALRA
jgi:hypothetical protein